MSGAVDLSFSRVIEWNRICVAPVSRSRVPGGRVPGWRRGLPVTSTAIVMSACSITRSKGTGLHSRRRSGADRRARRGAPESATPSWRPAPESVVPCREPPVRWRNSDGAHRRAGDDLELYSQLVGASSTAACARPLAEPPPSASPTRGPRPTGPGGGAGPLMCRDLAACAREGASQSRARPRARIRGWGLPARG